MLYKQEHFLKKCKETISDINILEKNNMKMSIENVKKDLEKKYSKMAMRKIVFIEKEEKKQTENPEEDNNKIDETTTANIEEKNKIEDKD